MYDDTKNIAMNSWMEIKEDKSKLILLNLSLGKCIRISSLFAWGI